MDLVDNGPIYQLYQSLLFTRIVPCVRDIGLWGDKVQKAYADMGVLDHAKADLVKLMKQDEEIAEDVDRAKAEKELADRQAEVHEAIAEATEA
jgi:hypothetical protein